MHKEDILVEQNTEDGWILKKELKRFYISLLEKGELGIQKEEKMPIMVEGDVKVGHNGNKFSVIFPNGKILRYNFVEDSQGGGGIAVEWGNGGENWVRIYSDGEIAIDEETAYNYAIKVAEQKVK